MKHTILTRTLLTTAMLMAGSLLLPFAPAYSESLEERLDEEPKALLELAAMDIEEPKALLESKAQEDILRGDLQPKCTGQADTACWLEIQNKPGCSIYNHSPKPNQTVTWGDSCSDGLANGFGEVQWTHDNGRRVESGILVDGKRQGCWGILYANGQIQEGPFVDGKREGLWLLPDDNGPIHIQYSNGQVQTASVSAAFSLSSMQTTKKGYLGRVYTNVVHRR